ncbi:MAG: prephenate dehydratase [Gammaproteobacteria bacterium]|nr:prephenate dehydratase [Gammaproteobacteria bacterium]
MTNDALKTIRERIDRLDEQIQKLISERAACAQEVAHLKNGGEEADFYRPEREAQVLRNVIARNAGPLSGEEMARLFREIMSACLALEQPMKIAFLGPEGTFTQAAALKHFGHSVTTVPLGAIDEVFREVESGAAHYGVVPVENSTEGVVNHTLDMFLASPLRICGEVELRIHHNLLGKLDDIAGVARVYAHQQALAQCREWLEGHLAGVEHVAVSSNAEAARRAAQETGAAAIASAAAAAIYGLKVLAANIEDEPDNTTRFLVIGRQSPPPSGNDKTSLLLSMRNRPGALHRLLEPLARHGISMTRIESRPSRRGMWDYVFFIDIEGHGQDPAVAKALQALGDEAAMLKVLGSYPGAVL